MARPQTSTVRTTTLPRRSAQCPELPVGDEAAGEFEEGFVYVGPAFPADSQAPEAVQPGNRPLDHPAVGAQASAVPCSSPGDRRDDAPSPDLITVDVMVIAAVREQRVGLATRPSDAATDGRDRVEQGQELGHVVAIAAGQQDGERSAVSVGDDVVLRAGPPTVDRRRARLVPPFSALTCEESTTQRDQSSREAAFSSASRTSCKRCQTPASFQSRNLRQHVMPEPKPSS